ncbi:hypothetical protein RJJ65_35680, partial [Rhizobium hidalgonense]
NLRDIVEQKFSDLNRMKKGTFESEDSFYAKFDKADREASQFEREKNVFIKEMEQEIAGLEGRKSQLNDQLFAGMDESDDF